MRKFAFELVTNFFALQITAVQNISYILLGILGSVGYWMMRLIDAKRLEVYNSMMQPDEQVGELQQQAMELRLLASASQVRDHAQVNDDWTDRHTEALNAIGDALITEAGWQAESVHAYLKDLVESIDGLTYGEE